MKTPRHSRGETDEWASGTRSPLKASGKIFPSKNEFYKRLKRMKCNIMVTAGPADWQQVFKTFIFASFVKHLAQKDKKKITGLSVADAAVGAGCENRHQSDKQKGRCVYAG